MSRGGSEGRGRDGGLALLERRALQFLVHSFLYYRLDETVISDAAFDRIAKDLRALRKANPKADIPHAKLIDGALGPEDTAFQIRAYPADIVTSAFKLLYGQQAPEMGFVEFVERRGYRAHLAHSTYSPSSASVKAAAKGKTRKGG